MELTPIKHLQGDQKLGFMPYVSKFFFDENGGDFKPIDGNGNKIGMPILQPDKGCCLDIIGELADEHSENVFKIEYAIISKAHPMYRLPANLPPPPVGVES